MNDKRREQLMDEYEEAALKLLMDEYAEIDGERLLREYEEAEKEGTVSDVPEDLDRKCRAIIRKNFAREKRNNSLVLLGRLSKKVAAFAIVLLGFFSTLFLTVDAVRLPVINFFLKNMGNHSVLVIDEPSQESMQGYSRSEFADMLVARLSELLPPGYSLVEGNFDENSVGFACFKHKGTDAVNFSIINVDSYFTVDTEDCDRCERLSDMSIEGYYIEKGNRNTVVWLNSSQSKIFTLISEALGKDDLLQIANTLNESENSNS